MSDSDHPASLQRLKPILTIGGCFLFGWLLISDPERCRTWFARADLLWLSMLSAAPFGIWLSGRVLSPLMTYGVASCSGLLAILLWSQVTTNEPSQSAVSTFTYSHLAVFASITALIVLMRIERKESNLNSLDKSAGIALFVMAMVTPQVYGRLVSTQLEETLTETIGSQRVTRSLELSQSLLALKPETVIQGRPLDEWQSFLQRQSESLESFLSRSENLPNRNGQRVMALMQLDRYNEALQILKPMLDNPRTAPIARDFAGLCHQRLKNWEQSRYWYILSRDGWLQAPHNPRRNEALLSAYRGIAFAERQLDNPRAAEEAYLSALELSESAEIHFLLARLYEGEQRSQAAATQIRKAVELAPDAYRDAGQKLLNKMAISHFGCLSLPGDASRRASR